jgi:hypothetical protein
MKKVKTKKAKGAALKKAKAKGMSLMEQMYKKALKVVKKFK